MDGFATPVLGNGLVWLGQCDQMLKLKEAQCILKVAQKVSTAVLTQKVTIHLDYFCDKFWSH